MTDLPKLPDELCYFGELKKGDKFGRMPDDMPFTVLDESTTYRYLKAVGGEDVEWHCHCVVYVIRKPVTMAVLEKTWDLQCDKLHDIRVAIDHHRVLRSEHDLVLHILSILDRT